MSRAAVGLLVLAACGGEQGVDLPVETHRLLAFSRTLGFRHGDAIEAGQRVLPERLAESQIAVDFTEDPSVFTADNLARYRAVFFMYTTGNDVVDGDGRIALEAFVGGGGGWIGIHSASDTEYEWPFYQSLVVEPFASHPAIQQATVTIEDRKHPATASLPEGPWVATDEWYNFPASARGVPGVRVLATIDETTYTGGTLGADHPMIWAHETLGGRAFYTELGHGATRWEEPAFLDHIDGAIRWVMHLAE